MANAMEMPTVLRYPRVLISFLRSPSIRVQDHMYTQPEKDRLVSSTRPQAESTDFYPKRPTAISLKLLPKLQRR
jgi:hypothetical protein